MKLIELFLKKLFREALVRLLVNAIHYVILRLKSTCVNCNTTNNIMAYIIALTFDKQPVGIDIIHIDQLN